MKGLRKVLSTENFLIFIYTYALTKYYIKSKDGLINALIIILRILITIPISLLIYGALIGFACFYEFVNIILTIKHGANYIGLLEGSDTIWNDESKTRSIICSLFILDAKENESCDILYQFFSTEYMKLSMSHEKLGCVRKRFLGFYYFLRTEIHIEKFVKYMEDYKDETELSALLDKYSNSPLPIGDEALWEVYIGKTPIKWKRNYGYLQYPVFIKYHHCMGDGISIVAMMTTNLIKNGLEIMKSKCDTYKAMLDKSKLKTRKDDKSIFNRCKKVLNEEFYIKYFGPLATKEINLLHGKSLSDEKHVCWGLEDENAGYVAKVKAIKNRFADISFNDVIMAAVSASFAEYYMKHDQNPPATIRCALTYYIASSDLDKIVTVRDDEVVSNLKNNFSIGVVDIPISENEIENNLLHRLRAVKKDSELLKRALDFSFIYWQCNVPSAVIPFPFLMYSIETNENTLVLTNVPGNNTSDILSGQTIRDTVIWAPNYLKTGISFSIFTYDDLFRFGLLVDKVIIEDRKEIQTILDNVFKYIDLLDKVTSNIKI